MPTGAPKLITAPADEPITLAEAKAQCRVTHDAENAAFLGWIKTAREMCEEDLGIALMEQTLEQVADCFPVDSACEIRISRPPLKSVTSITYYDSTGAANVWDSANYLVDSDSFPARILPKSGKTWPTAELQPANGVRIRFVAGWAAAGAVPSRLKSGMLLIIGSLWKNREAEITDARAASAAIKLDSDTQSAVDRLWKRYKRKL